MGILRRPLCVLCGSLTGGFGNSRCSCGSFSSSGEFSLIMSYSLFGSVFPAEFVLHPAKAQHMQNVKINNKNFFIQTVCKFIKRLFNRLSNCY